MDNLISLINIIIYQRKSNNINGIISENYYSEKDILYYSFKEILTYIK